jgi:hypothetical protein
MAGNKTKATKVSVSGFLASKASGQQLSDSKALAKLFAEVTGKPARMWGPSIVGFGSYHYVYASGREGDAPLLGFSPRKLAIVLYVAPFPGDGELKQKLGSYAAGAGCLYVKKLADIDLGVLRKLARASVKALQARYPVE